MIRLAPLATDELPAHPSLATASRPDLAAFALALLDQGEHLLRPENFNIYFKHHSMKSSPPSNNEVEVLSTEVSASKLNSIHWDTDQVLRKKPAQLEDEFWYARRSQHHNVPNKHNSPGTASWDEFQFGILYDHSKHEMDFTPTVYDARPIIDWNTELQNPEILQKFTDRPAEKLKYRNLSMGIIEMCHRLPHVMSPRAFPVLVITATVSDSEFIAVTVPVNISGLKEAFYSNGRNRTEGSEAQMKKSAVLGLYCAVERIHRYAPQEKHAEGEEPKKLEAHTHEGKHEEIEWVMATASDAKGTLPMFMQRLALPGEVVKDVGRFLKWIKKVPDEEIKARLK